MAKRRPCCPKNAVPLLCFCAAFAYGTWILSWHDDLWAGDGVQASDIEKGAAQRLLDTAAEALDNQSPAEAPADEPAEGSPFAEDAAATPVAEKEELPALPPAPLQQHAAASTGDAKLPLTIALAARLKQLDGPLVVISSALAHARDPSRLQFRVLTTAEDAKPLVSKLKARLAKQAPSQTLDIAAVDFDPWNPRVEKLLGGKSSSRKELFDGLNFAAFYLHEVLPDASGGRVLYLDTDVVVKSDLASELVGRDLHGMPAAVAEDCSQKLGKYIDMEKVKKRGVPSELPLQLHATKKACVVNRGVVLIDIARWASANITGAIEVLVAAHLTKGRGPLWRAGVSQPPFLLAIAGRYHDLGAEYNVRGLGRGDIAPEEVDHYKKQKAWSSYYDKFLRKCEFNCCPGCKGWALSPFVSPLALRAKILHFNGRLKPSAAGRRDTAPLAPPPSGMEKAEQSAREQRPLCSCGKDCVQECAGLWWKYLPPE